MIRRVLREPLVHFVVLGGLIFAVAAWRTAARDDARVIVLGPDDLAGLRADFARRTGAPPAPVDEQALIDRFVDDEILYREALALGLDRGDVIVRRRLLQKMEFLIDARADAEEPSRAALVAWRDAHPDRYRVPARLDVEHVFVDPTRHGAAAGDVARRLRTALAGGADPARAGDPFVRGRVFRAQSRDDLARIFGPEFAETVTTLPAGEWSGPVRSTYGLHLVRVLARTPPRLPAVEEIEPALRQDWLEARRAEVRREALRELRRRYTVRVAREPRASP